MVKLDTYADISGTSELIQEFDYVSVDSLSYLHAVAIDVTEYWQEIVNRCAQYDETDGRNFYSSQSVSTWNQREARDRVIKALKDRADAQLNRGWYEEGIVNGWTGILESNFYNDFAYDSAPLVRDGMMIGWLLFVSAYNGNGYDSGLDYVFQLDNWEDLYQALSPTVEFYCEVEGCKLSGETLNGGYSFEVIEQDGSFAFGQDIGKDLLRDGQAYCPNGHKVSLYVREDF